MSLAVLRRLIQVLFTLHRHKVLHAMAALNPSTAWGARWARFFLPIPSTDFNSAHQLRTGLEHLGPIFIKLGQVLSTRPDILPEAYIHELAHLQDRVSPVPTDTIRAIFAQQFGQSVDAVFSEFDDTPVATASVAQVHKARIRDGSWAGRAVAVKCLRPNIAETIRVDIACLYWLARQATRRHIDGPRLRLPEIVAEIEQHLHDELDLQCEAANGSELRHHFADSDLLFVPEICWDWCGQRVLVQEWMVGVPASNLDALHALNIDLPRLARDGVEVFFTQVFRDGFFHADMHPGNVFVGTEGAALGHYIALDCGIMGSLSDEDKHYLAVNFLAFFNRDYRGVAAAHIESGWVPADTPMGALTATVRTVCEPYFGRPISEISLGQVLMRLFEVSRRFNVRVQPQLVLLQKTLLNIEGMGRVLDPNLDLWSTAKPYLQQSMRETLGPKGLWRQIKRDWPSIAYQFPLASQALLRRAQQSDPKIQQLLAGQQRQHDEITTVRKNQHVLIAIYILGMVAAGLMWFMKYRP